MYLVGLFWEFAELKCVCVLHQHAIDANRYPLISIFLFGAQMKNHVAKCVIVEPRAKAESGLIHITVVIQSQGYSHIQSVFPSFHLSSASHLRCEFDIPYYPSESTTGPSAPATDGFQLLPLTSKQVFLKVKSPVHQTNALNTSHI